MAAAADKAAKEASASGCGIFDGLRWVMIMVMMVVIRFLSCRCCTLIEIKLAHISVADDSDSPLAAVMRFFLPKHKADRLGTNGGAAMRAYPNLYNQYLDPTLAVALWILLIRPYLKKAYDDECEKLREGDRKAGKASDEPKISQLALQNLYLFPHVASSGNLDFSKHVEHASASNLLKEIKEAAGFGERSFTWHGIVSTSMGPWI